MPKTGLNGPTNAELEEPTVLVDANNQRWHLDPEVVEAEPLEDGEPEPEKEEEREEEPKAKPVARASRK